MSILLHQINNLKLIKLFFLFFLFHIFEVNSCYLYEDDVHFNSLNNVDSIEVNFKNTKKYIRNIFNNKKNNSPFILKETKNNLKANLKVFYNNKKDFCEYKALVRINGDYKDHIGEFNSSLKVKILDGNIGGITKFKLFIKKTRNFNGEIFVTNLLNSFDILTPRTKKIALNIKIHDNFNNYETVLFQEDFSKELVESRKRKESIFYEFNEDFLYSRSQFKELNQDLNLSGFLKIKPINKKFESNNYETKYIAAKAKRILFDAQALRYKIMDELNIDHSPLWIPLDFILSKNDYLISKYINYNLVMIGSDAFHGLFIWNQKYFWNYDQSGFEIIYYDGFSDDSNIDNIKIMFTKSIPLYSNIITQENINNLINHIDSLDHINFYNNLVIYGYDESYEQLLKRLNKIRINLNSYLKIEFDNNLLNVTQANSLVRNSFISYLLNLIPEAEVTESYINDNNKFFEIPINQNYDNSKKTKNYNFIYESGLSDDIKSELNKFKNNDLEIIYTNGIDINFDKKNKTINIYQNNPDDWVKFTNSKLSNKKISFIKNYNFSILKNNNSRFNIHGITGCLTILNSVLDNVDIESNCESMEDSVNIVNSSGDINNIKISNSFQDALDIDFSNINIQKVYINNAGNDCLDFSYGYYSINEADLSNCSDKAISVGESSIFDIVNVTIANSNFGIVSKDLSDVNVNLMTADNINTCFAAYQKKQEYGPSVLNIKSFNCSYEKLFLKDKYSIINYEL